MPLEGPTGRKFELYPPLTPTQTIPQGIDGGGIPKREAVSQSWFWATFFKWGEPTELWDGCLTDSAVAKRRSRRFRNITQLCLGSKSRRVSIGRPQLIKFMAHIWAITWIAVNSYPGKCVLEGTTFERVEPPCIIFVVLVEVVPEGISPHFQVLLLQVGRQFFKSWNQTRYWS